MPSADIRNGEIEADGLRFRYRESGSGEPLICLDRGGFTRAHELLAERHRVIVLEIPEGLSSGSDGAVGAVGGAAAKLGVEGFDLIGAGAMAGLALSFALARPKSVRALVVFGPTLMARDGSATAKADEALVARLGELSVPSLALFGTKDAAAPVEAARHYRERIPTCNLMLVYDAGPAMSSERPEAVASVVLDFLERHDHFLVRRESDLIHP